MSDVNKQAMLKIARWRKDPVSFVTECFGVSPDAWQLDVLRAFPTNQRIAMKACKGPGKSCVMAWLSWNFLATRPNPKIVATSISGPNLQDGLWAEMAKWQAKSPFLTQAFEWKKESITPRQKLPEHNDWMMVARQWSAAADSSQQSLTLAGKHADYMLFVLDEAGGIPDAVMAAAEAALASGIECKILMAGNPTHLEGPLYRACTSERQLWHVTEITSDPDDPKRTPRVSAQWAREQIEKYGADSAYVLVNVFGRFPPSSLNSLLGPDEIHAAMKRHLREDQYAFSQKRLGIDVARFGSDRTVIFPRQGMAAFKPFEMRDARSNEIGDKVIMVKNEWKSEQEFVDDTGGYGGGVVDYLMINGYSPLGVNFSSKATDSRYANKRAEMWFRMAEWIKKGGALPNIPELSKELSAPTYSFQNGKFLLESKDQIKDRLGYSPDLADALCVIGSTEISTPNGRKRIDSLSVGELVTTPMGFKKIQAVWVRKTDTLSEVRFSNGSTLIGKPDHKVFTWDDGWVKLGSLQLDNCMESDSIVRLLIWKILRSLFTRENHTGFKAQVDTINQGIKLGRRGFFTGECGLIKMVKYLMGTISTIKMEIGEITTLITSSVLMGTIINQNTCSRKWQSQNLDQKHYSHSRRHSSQQQNGIKVTREEHGILNTGKTHGKEEENIAQKIHAYFAIKHSKHTSQQERSFVGLGANDHTITKSIKLTLDRAFGVVKSLLLTSIGLQKVVPVYVQTKSVGQERVYNLTIEDENVYYANGILVANCLTFAQQDVPTARLDPFKSTPDKYSGKLLSQFDPFDTSKL